MAWSISPIVEDMGGFRAQNARHHGDSSIGRRVIRSTGYVRGPGGLRDLEAKDSRTPRYLKVRMALGVPERPWAWLCRTIESASMSGFTAEKEVPGV